MNKRNKVYIAIILFSIDLVNTEVYDEIPEADYEQSESVGSESNEVYNVSSKEKPNREVNAELKGKFIKDSWNESKSNIFNSTVTKPDDSPKCSNTQLSNYPYSVSIQKKNAHYATGALIHKKWILTVASEFYNVRESIKLFKARLGSVNCKKGGVLVSLKGIEINPSYIYNEPNNDLAMLRIGHSVQCSDNIKPIALSVTKEPILSAKFLVTYWPRLIINGKVLAQSAKERMKQYSMRVSNQNMIPWDKCFNITQAYNHTLDESSLCLEPLRSHHSPCMPDVGAPVVADDGLWGITSAWVSNDCLRNPSPTVVTSIASEPITSWLDSLLDVGL